MKWLNNLTTIELARLKKKAELDSGKLCLELSSYIKDVLTKRANEAKDSIDAALNKE